MSQDYSGLIFRQKHSAIADMQDDTGHRAPGYFPEHYRLAGGRFYTEQGMDFYGVGLTDDFDSGPDPVQYVLKLWHRYVTGDESVRAEMEAQAQEYFDYLKEGSQLAKQAVEFFVDGTPDDTLFDREFATFLGFMIAFAFIPGGWAAFAAKFPRLGKGMYNVGTFYQKLGRNKAKVAEELAKAAKNGDILMPDGTIVAKAVAGEFANYKTGISVRNFFVNLYWLWRCANDFLDSLLKIRAAREIGETEEDWIDYLQGLGTDATVSFLQPDVAPCLLMVLGNFIGSLHPEQIAKLNSLGKKFSPDFNVEVFTHTFPSASKAFGQKVSQTTLLITLAWVKQAFKQAPKLLQLIVQKTHGRLRQLFDELEEAAGTWMGANMVAALASAFLDDADSEDLAAAMDSTLQHAELGINTEGEDEDTSGLIDVAEGAVDARDDVAEEPQENTEVTEELIDISLDTFEFAPVDPSEIGITTPIEVTRETASSSQQQLIDALFGI